MKKNRFHYMKMHWENYTINAMGMPPAEFGALMFLTARYWMTAGPIPDDDNSLAVTTHQSLESWLEMRPRVVRFFQISDGLLCSEHIDELIADTRLSSERQSKRVSKRYEKPSELEHVVIPFGRSASDDDVF